MSTRMPTLLVWEYGGGIQGSLEAARRGEQRVYPGDATIDVIFGAGKVVRLDGADLICEFTEEHGKQVEKACPCAYAYAVACRERREQRTVLEGRAQQRGTFSLLARAIAIH